MNKFIAFFIPLFLLSCTKVIELDIQTGSRKYVIQGEITNQAPPYYIEVSTNAPLADKAAAEQIKNALVIISDNTGVVDTLFNLNNGKYQTNKIVGKEGVVYNLKVNINDTIYSATSVMPTIIPMDSLVINKAVGFREDFMNIVPSYQDAEGEANYYRFKAYRGDSLVVKNILFTDELSNGKRNSRPFFMELKNDDSLTVEMRALNYDAYRYFFGVNQITPGGQSQSATPTNPISNISGGVLGFFSANTLEVIKMKMKIVK